MRCKQRLAFALASAFLAVSTVSYAGTAKPAPQKPRVVTILGKKLCFGEVAPGTKCDFRMPAGSQARKKAKHAKSKQASSGARKTR